MIILKLLALGILGFFIFWFAGKFRETTFGYGWLWSAILENMSMTVRIVLFYVSSAVALAYLYYMSFASVYFLAVAIGGTIPVVRCAIIDFRDYFGR